MTINKLLSDNWIKLTVAGFVSATVIYDSLGDLKSVAWAVLYYAIIYLSLSIFCYKASKYADDIQEMLIGYGFCIFCLINFGLVFYAGVESAGDIDMFWDIINHKAYIYIMLAVGMTTSYGAYFLNRLIK